MRRFSTAVLAVMMAVVAYGIGASPAIAEDKECPERELVKAGTVEATGKTVGFIVAMRWGEGTLTLNDGSQHRFHASSAKLVETGAAEVEITGTVYNLERLEDFEGDYGAVSADLTLGKGIGGGSMLSNDNCVYIDVEIESQGLRASAPAPGGILLEFEN